MKGAIGALFFIADRQRSRRMASLGPLRKFFSFPPVRALVAFFWIAIFMAAAESLARVFFPSSSPVVSLALVPGALIGYYTFVRVIERRSAHELISPGSTRELLVGLIFGAALMSAVMWTMYIASAYSADGFNRPAVAIPALVAAVMAGVTEELLIRAAVFRIIERWLGSWLALGLTAILFGAMHIPNPNATSFSTLSVAVGGGVMLCAAYIATRRIWGCCRRIAEGQLAWPYISHRWRIRTREFDRCTHCLRAGSNFIVDFRSAERPVPARTWLAARSRGE